MFYHFRDVLDIPTDILDMRIDAKGVDADGDGLPPPLPLGRQRQQGRIYHPVLPRYGIVNK